MFGGKNMTYLSFLTKNFFQFGNHLPIQYFWPLSFDLNQFWIIDNWGKIKNDFETPVMWSQWDKVTIDDGDLPLVLCDWNLKIVNEPEEKKRDGGEENWDEEKEKRVWEVGARRRKRVF